MSIHLNDTNPFAGTPCRACGVAALRLEWRRVLSAHPATSFSLSGAQDKFSASYVDWPYAVCDHCGAECRGKKS